MLSAACVPVYVIGWMGGRAGSDSGFGRTAECIRQGLEGAALLASRAQYTTNHATPHTRPLWMSEAGQQQPPPFRQLSVCSRGSRRAFIFTKQDHRTNQRPTHRFLIPTHRSITGRASRPATNMGRRSRSASSASSSSEPSRRGGGGGRNTSSSRRRRSSSRSRGSSSLSSSRSRHRRQRRSPGCVGRGSPCLITLGPAETGLGRAHHPIILLLLLYPTPGGAGLPLPPAARAARTGDGARVQPPPNPPARPAPLPRPGTAGAAAAGAAAAAPPCEGDGGASVVAAAGAAVGAGPVGLTGAAGPEVVAAAGAVAMQTACGWPGAWAG